MTDLEKTNNFLTCNREICNHYRRDGTLPRTCASMCSYPLETRACLVLVVLCSHTLFPLSRERRPEKTGQSGVACAAAPPLSLGLLAHLRHLGRSVVGGSVSFEGHWLHNTHVGVAVPLCVSCTKTSQHLCVCTCSVVT